MKIVLDSNILIAGTNAADANAVECDDLIRKLNEGAYEIVAPVTQLWEIAAYWNHPEKRKSHVGNSLSSFTMRHHDVTQELFLSTYSDAITAIRGPDRVFVSLAKYLGVPLITNDAQILKNATLLGVRAMCPGEFMGGGADQHILAGA